MADAEDEVWRHAVSYMRVVALDPLLLVILYFTGIWKKNRMKIA